MTLHINNPEADRLAQELARRTGKPVEQALIDVLREKVDQLPEISAADEQDFTWENVKKIIDHIATLPVYDTRRPDDILYDENGLPT
jgi:antitoxin VapB